MKARRILRRLGFDRNPLRRRSDRIEAWLTAAAVAVLLTAGPFLVWRASLASYTSAAAVAARDRARQGVTVVAVLQDDPAKYLVPGTDGSDQQGPVPASWTGPDGSVHAAPVIPPAGSRSGGPVAITTDLRGNPVQPPTPPNPLASAVETGAAVGFAFLLGAIVLRVTVRLLLNRRRMADWQVQWLLVERRWSGRR